LYILTCDRDNDNINTDGIYPGKYTYQDNLPKEKMAEVCMENYDPEFTKLTKPGDVLVTGFNFGCGKLFSSPIYPYPPKKRPLTPQKEAPANKQPPPF